MKHSSSLMTLLCSVLLVSGCAVKMVSMSETERTRTIPEGASKEKVRQAIIEGVENAGWSARDQGISRILANYQVRIHTVQVSIYYSGQYYRIQYQSSTAMKMYCSASDKKYRRAIVSGSRNCPGDRPPYFIHANYGNWIDGLAASIDRSLETRL